MNSVNTFTNVDECINFISSIKEEKTFIISSGALGQTAVRIVHDMVQVSAIYIFCGDKARHTKWAKQWPKVNGVFTDISSICETLKRAVQRCDQNTISMSFVTLNSGTNNENLDQLNQSFMYTQILKEILLTINFKQKHIDEFITYCRQQLAGNMAELKNVDKLEREYHNHVPIWWYTYHCFLYSMLNRALRTMEVDLIINMGFFVRDLHNHIAQLHAEQYAGQTSSNSFTVYRGQGLSQKDFDQMIKIKGGLMSFNNFLSTSIDHQVSLHFARETMENSDLVGVLFIIKIDPSILSTPYANICRVSYFHDEQEILFSMHSIFRIGQMKRIDGNNRLWHVDLALTGDHDPQLHALTEQIRKEVFPDADGWHRLGYLLIKLGQFGNAQQVYEVMLDQATVDDERARIYHFLGMVKCEQGECTEGITFFKQSNEILKKTLSSTDPDLASSYNNIGAMYDRMGDYSAALSYDEKAFEMWQKSLPPNHPDLATSYHSIGGVYRSTGEYSKALSFYEKTFAIRQISLPPGHPDSATNYHKFGSVYEKMGEYSKALSYYVRALAIQERSLPSKHPDLQAVRKNIDIVKKKL